MHIYWTYNAGIRFPLICYTPNTYIIMHDYNSYEYLRCENRAPIVSARDPPIKKLGV